MENLNHLRGFVWVSFLLDRGGFKSLADMHESLNVVGSVQLWSAYKVGKAKPQESTIKLVDRAVPGSGAIWNCGPVGLPLWAVLDGDLAVCRLLVVSLLNSYLEPEPWMSVARMSVASMNDYEIVKALFEIVLPQSLWQPSTAGSVRYNPNAPHKMELVGWLSLNEIFTLDENALAVTYIKDKIKEKQKSIIKKFVYEMLLKNKDLNSVPEKSICNLVNPEYLIGFLALIQICNQSKNKNLINMPEFIKVGIEQAMFDFFGSPIADFYKTI